MSANVICCYKALRYVFTPVTGVKLADSNSSSAQIAFKRPLLQAATGRFQ
jgi:hypothetical protein